MLATVLIIVTLGHADAPHVSFSQAENLEACEAKAEALTSVLERANYQVGATRCVQTELTLSPYDRAAKEFPHAFRISLPNDASATIEQLDSLSECTAAPDADPAVFCAVSAQTIAQ